MVLRRVLLAGVALVATAAMGWIALGGTSRPTQRAEPALPYRAGGVTVSRVPAGGLGGGDKQGARDDLLVQNGRISFVMGAVSVGTPERRARFGSLLDLALKDFDADELAELRPLARSSGKSLSFMVSAVTVATEGTHPYLVIDQVSKDGHVRMSTDFRAPPGSARVELVSRLKNLGPTTLRAVEIGERTRWPGAPTFAPRVGFPRLTSRAEVPWLIREGSKLSYALAFPQGPVDAQFLFDRIGQVGQETLYRVGDVPPSGEAIYRRELIVTEGGLARAADALFRALKRPVGHVRGQLYPPPPWAVIEARYPDGKPALSVRLAPDGRYRLPLPIGDYELALRAPGGEDVEHVSIQEENVTIEPKLIAPVPGRLSYSITDGDGAASPARIVFRGISPTKDPELGPFQYGGGAKNVVFTRTGAGEVELPAGRYRIVITRGPEYEIVDQEVDLDGQTGVAIRAELQRSVDTAGWVGCDFHLHAEHSPDSGVTLDDRVLSLLAEGVEFAVPTDHNHVTDYTPSIVKLGGEPPLGTTSGIEITTPTWGHFNAYPYPLDAEPPPFSGVNPAEIFAVVRSRAPEAIIQVNHPRMPGVGYFNRIELDHQTGQAQAEEASLDFDAIEVVNGYDLEDPKLIDQNVKEYFALLNFGRRYVATGNSDSHRMIINWAGYPRTYLRVPDDRPSKVRPADVARSVAEGHAQVSNGIFIALAVNQTAGPGDTVSGRRVTVQAEARSPSWVTPRTIELWLNGALVSTHKLPTRVRGRATIVETELEVNHDAWLVVLARGDQPMNAVFLGRRVLPFAFTNPIYIDADEDGTVHAPETPEPDARAAP